MTSPDAIDYVDLRLFDKDSQDVFQAAIVALQTYLPAWDAREGHTEVVLLEALALEVSEAVFALNRLPGSTLEGVLRLYGIVRNPGTAPRTRLTFTVSSTSGHTLPAGTRASLPGVFGGDPVVFSTTAALTIPAGSTSGSVEAVGSRPTDELNGTSAGIAMDLLDALVFVERVVNGDTISGGIPPEDDAAWFSRGVTRFSRLVETLVLPRHFQAAAIERTELVSRAIAIDNYSPELANELQTITISGAPTGGTFTLSYGGSTTGALPYNATAAAIGTALNGLASLGAGAVSATGGPLPTDPVAVQFVGPNVAARDVALITADGALLTGGAAPAVNVAQTRAGGTGPGSHAGHVTVAVYGLGAVLTAAQMEELRVAFDLQAQANLAVHVVAPTINDVPIDVTVVAEVGHDPATVRTAVIAALDRYLSPGQWPWAGVVYRNELIALLDGVVGVRRVETLTTPAANLALAGVAPLARLAANPVVTVLAAA